MTTPFIVALPALQQSRPSITEANRPPTKIEMPDAFMDEACQYTHTYTHTIKPFFTHKMVWRESDGTRRFFLTIENYHPGPEDVTRTRFIVRGETAAEVLENIVDNTQPSFAKKSENFYKAAYLFYRGPDSCGRKPLAGTDPIPESVENLHLLFRPWAKE